MVQKATYCRVCEALCGLNAEINESGQVIKLSPDKSHPVSRGHVCAKGTQFAKFAAHPNRLLEPQIRDENGRLSPATWQDAIAHIAEKINPIIKKHGPHAVGIYHGNPMLFNSLGLLSVLRFNRVLGTRNVFSSFSVDNNNKFKASQLMYGGDFIQSIPDLEHADFGLFLGFNPAISQGSFVHLEGGSSAFDRFQTRGGKALWVDPWRSESAQRWGDHLKINPNSDIYFLLALLNEFADETSPHPNISGLDKLFELAKQYPAEKTAVYTQIPAETVKQVAMQIRESNTATFHLSVGVNRGPFGTLAHIVLQAIAYVSSNFDQKGGLIFNPMGNLMSWLMKASKFGTHPKPSRIGGLTGIFDEMPAGILADEILTPGDEQIRALIVIGGNPLTAVPEEAKLSKAFKNLEFMVSIDLFENQTGQFSDVLLPTTSWLERTDIASTAMALQKSPFLQYSAPMQKPAGKTIPEWRILSQISVALNRPMFLTKWLTKQVQRLSLDKILFNLINLVATPFRLRHKMAHVFPILTPKNGRFLKKHHINFWHPELNAEPERLASLGEQLKPVPQENGNLHLKLITRRRRLGHNSWLHKAKHEGQGDDVAWMAPEDLLQLGLPNGGKISLHNQDQTIKIMAKPKTAVSSGIIVVPHGLRHLNINKLMPSGLDFVEPLSGIQWMSGFSVQVKSLETEAISQTPISS